MSRRGRIWTAMAALAVAAAILVGWLASRPTLPAAGSARRISERHWVVRNEAKREYLADVARATSGVRLDPVYDGVGSSIKGVRIVGVDASSPVALAGFQVDDLVVRVNGTPIETLQRAVHLVHEVRQSSRLTVDVDRKGLRLSYQFDFVD